MFPNAHTFVAKSVAYGAKQGGGTIANFTELNQLVDGAVVFTDDTNNLLLPAGAPHNSVTGFKVWQKSAGSGLVYSGAIPRDSLHYSVITYKAPVAQKVAVGLSGGVGSLNLPAVLIPGEFVGINVVDVTVIESVRSRLYEVAIVNGDTVATLLGKLINVINADMYRKVNAALIGATDGIMLTAINDAVVVVGGTGNLGNATIHDSGANNSALPFRGFGTTADVKSLVELRELALGRSVDQYAEFASALFKATEIVNGNYDILTIQWNSEARAAFRVAEVAHPVVYIAIPTGTNADVLTILNGLTTGTADKSGGAPEETSSGELLTVAAVPTGGKK